MSEVEVSVISFQIDQEIILYVIAASITTVVTLIFADSVTKNSRQLQDDEAYRKTLRMLEEETKNWRDAKRAVTTYCAALSDRIAIYQSKVKDIYEEMATGGGCGSQYLERRVQSLGNHNGMVIERMIETQLLDVEKRRLQLLLQDFDGSYHDEADEFSVPSESESCSDSDLSAASLSLRRSRKDKPRYHTVTVNTPLAEFSVHIQIPEEGPITLLDVSEKIKSHEQWPLYRQQLLIGGELVTDLDREVGTDLVRVELNKVQRFSWKSGKQIERSNVHGYDILRMNLSVDLGEVRWVSLRLKSGNNESHDVGALAPRFNPAFGTERWIVSLYTEGGIAAHDVPRLINPNTELTLLINGITKHLYWYTASLPTGTPCSSMQLLTNDFPLTPCVQTHGVGAEFEIVEI